MKTVEIILSAAAIPALCVWFGFALRHYLHMFQQNSYKGHEQRVWLKKNGERQRLLTVLGVLGILGIPFLILRSDIALIILLILILLLSVPGILYYNFLKKTKAKKKLVMTWRARRLALSSCLLLIVLSGLAAILFMLLMREEVRMILRSLPFAAAVWIALTPYLLLLADLVNRPVEAAIRQSFINDAKKRLREQKGMVVIGVTGSYGKTSVKYYLDTLLRVKYQVLITPESFNTPMGVVRTIRENMKNTDEIFICEMGARNIGDIRELCDIVHPQHGIITAVGPQHLETFKNIENVRRTKFELADALPKDGMLFLNWDNEYIRSADPANETVIRYGSGEGATYTASDISVSATGTGFTVRTPEGEQEHYEMQLVGMHNVINVLGAITVAHCMGISLSQLRTAVRKLRPVAHRMQLVDHGNGITIIDDAYNSNPVGSKAAVETLKLFDGMRILITPGMVELGDEEEHYNHEFGRYAADCCDRIILVGSKRAEPIAAGVREAGFPEEHLHISERFEDAYDYACRISSEKHKYILLENDLPDNYT